MTIGMTKAGAKPVKHGEDVMRQQLSRGRKTEIRATALYLIRSIVEKHGGTIEMDLATDTINIDVPEKERVACTQEIEEQVGTMCC
jgi:sensor histidine kinase regulating citrate/malate metabolism